MQKRVQSFFLLLIITAQNLFSMSYDDDVLDIFAKLSPRMLLMSSPLKSKDDTLSICLLHQSVDAQSTSYFEQKVHQNYKQGIKNFQLHLKKVLFSEIESCGSSDMLFLFRSNEEELEKTLLYAKEHNILTIAYDAKALESGVDVSLYFGRKVVPYVNMASIKSKDISLNNVFLRISKIYNPQKQGDRR